jgi:hypothetical protein
MKRGSDIFYREYCDRLATEIALSLSSFSDNGSEIDASSSSKAPKPIHKDVQLAAVFFLDEDVQDVIFHMLGEAAFADIALKSGISISGLSRGRRHTNLLVDFDVVRLCPLTGRDLAPIYLSMV